MLNSTKTNIPRDLNHIKLTENYYNRKGRLGAIGTMFCSIFALSAIQIAHAQEERPTNNAIEEIIVTAEKTEKSLQTTALAVSVMSGTFLEDNRISDFTDIATRIPGFSISNDVKTQASISLRGIGSLEDSAGVDQAVGVFIDDVYMGNSSTFDFDLFDLERVEVLRGPQGTIFGKNVVGGAINFITRNPSREQVAKVEATMGRFNRFDIRGSLSGPIVDNELFGLISFSSSHSDGYTYNEFTGNRLDQDDVASGRAKLLWTPNDNFEALLGADYSRDTSYGISRVIIGPAVPIVGTVNTDPLVANQDLDGGYDRTMWGASLKMTFALENDAEMVSISSYRKSDHLTNSELDSTPAPSLHFRDMTANIRQFTQELRLSNSLGDLDYIAGIYYYNADYSRIESFDVDGQTGSLIDLFVGDGPFPETLGQVIKTISYAGFAQGTYNVSDRLRLTVGGRYTWEEKTGSALCILPGLQCGEGVDTYDAPLANSWNSFTPKFTVDYDINDDVFAYATVSKGFKSGGYGTSQLAAEAQDPFDPEKAWNYEIGLKSRWFEDRLQVNIAGYHVKYSDLQYRFLGEGGFASTGTGDAKNHGIEVEFVARPATGLDVWANYVFQDGEYTDLVIEGVQLAGNRTILTPKHSISMGASYSVDLPNGGGLTIAGDFTHKTRSLTDPGGELESAQQIDGLVNGYISYQFPNEQWELKLSGKNLTNERVEYGISGLGVFVLPVGDYFDGEQTYGTHYGPPATWAATISVNF